MLFDKNKKKWYARSLALMAMGTLALVSSGCSGGGDSYDTATVAEASTAATNRILSVDDLKAMVDAGKVNSGGFDNVVILDVAASADADHIPGAVVFSTAPLYQTRIEGPGTAISLLADGTVMDAALQAAGIDENTTIVLAGGNLMRTSRAYFALRYWGFPKNSLYILDGLNGAWADAGYSVTPGADGRPIVTASTYSVKNNSVLEDGVRASVGDILAVAEDDDPNTVILDARGASYYPGTDAVDGGLSQAKSYLVVGRLRGALEVDTATSDFSADGISFRAADDLMTRFLALDPSLDGTESFITHCFSGTGAARVFAALDAVLGWDVSLYDASWYQLGMMADTANGGTLPASSVWVPPGDGTRFDAFAWGDDLWTAANGDTITGRALKTPISLVDDATLTLMTSVSSSLGNQVENEDAIYVLSGGDDDTGSDSLSSGDSPGC